MENIRKILRERSGGLFLLMAAFLIISGVSLNSPKAESKNEQSLSSEDNAFDDSQVLGEANNDSEEAIMSGTDAESSSDGAEVSEEKIIPDPKTDTHDNLKNNLKKYCNKSGSDNKKKCKNYCIEAKNNSRYKDLNKKYCNKEKDEEETVAVAASGETVLTLDFVISSGSGTEKFAMEFKEGETVYELMKEAKAQGKMTYGKSADETYGVYINEINGQKEGSDADWTNNKYWILYVSGKSSNLGCSSHKLNKSDTSVEWKYEKYSF